MHTGTFVFPESTVCLKLCVKTIIPDGVASSLNETGRALDELERTIAKMMTEAGVDQ